MEDDSTKKPHRKRQAGAKIGKKKTKKSDVEKTAKKRNVTAGDEKSARERNPRAFSFHSVVKTSRKVRRTLDLKEKKHHIPRVDRTPTLPPPMNVVIVGPPKVGKTTLLRGIIRKCTKQKLTDIKGPVTIVTGKKKRITFFECNNDFNSMVDLAKVANLVLLLIDASFGFEMEIFEFLNIVQQHGEVKVIGVLTHLDHFRHSKEQTKTRKRLKRRFWTEVYQGAKLFYCSGFVRGQYLDNDMKNLLRFLSIQRAVSTQWQTTHPFVLADRMEDVTDPEAIRQNPKVDRSVCLYGYNRGTLLKKKSDVHFVGVGDFAVSDICFLPDPCPFPDRVKKRSLNERERGIYAPFSGVGGLIYDRDATYVDIGGSKSKEKPLNEFISSIIESKTPIDSRIGESSVQLFTGSAPISSLKDTFQDDDNDDDENGDDNENTEGDAAPKIRERRKVIFDDNDESDGDNDDETDGDDENDDDEDLSDNDGEKGVTNRNETEMESSGKKKKSDNDPKQNRNRKAADSFYARQNRTTNWNKAVYGGLETIAKVDNDSDEEPHEKHDSDSETEFGGIFRAVKEKEEAGCANDVDSSVHVVERMKDWEEENGEVLDLIRNCFVTGKWDNNEDAKTRLEQDDELYGDFEDLESGAKSSGPERSKQRREETSSRGAKSRKRKADDDDKSESGTESESDNGSDGSDTKEDGDIEEEEKTKKSREEKRDAKKQRLKALFDEQYDESGGGTHYDKWKKETEDQAQLNRSIYADLGDDQRVELEGFRPGMYVRVQIDNVPCEFVQHFDPTYPLVLGGLLPGEQNVGCVRINLKKHRWHKRILKTRDPLIISMGWRRFQTVVLYTIRDHNERNRLIKYTPEHIYCDAIFWGPIVPQKTGMLGYQTSDSSTPDFRICVTGNVRELDKSLRIAKKLKLTGVPYHIMRNTAFIKGMFNSKLEVAKFHGCRIQTVSGIRGRIKGSAGYIKGGKVANRSLNHRLNSLKAKAKKVADAADEESAAAGEDGEGERPLHVAAGNFRATFEDKILKSDIVFVKTWFQVQVPEYYNPMTTLLLPSSERSKWQGMKTVGQLRREQGIRRDVNVDHLYKPIARRERTFAPLTVPKTLQRDLPFKDKPKVERTARDQVESKRVPKIREPNEKKIADFVKQLETVYKEKRRKLRLTMRERAGEHRSQMEKINAGKMRKHKETAKNAYRKMGKLEKRRKKKKVPTATLR